MSVGIGTVGTRLERKREEQVGQMTVEEGKRKDESKTKHRLYDFEIRSVGFVGGRLTASHYSRQ